MHGTTRLVALAVAPAIALLLSVGCDSGGASPGVADATPVAAGDARLAEASDDRASGLEVEGAGVVERLLPDDEEGSRHQRFILRLGSGQTLLVVHNIDIAPRVEGLRVGDTVAFRGVYEWSAEGGTIHWTHDDPAGRRAPGWLRHDGIAYQ